MPSQQSLTTDEFNHEASRYHPEVYHRKRDDLLEKANASLHFLFIGQLRNVHKKAMLDFKHAVHNIVKDGGENFAERLVESQAQVSAFYQRHAQGTLFFLDVTA
jgi:hypothetical protein